MRKFLFILFFLSALVQNSVAQSDSSVVKKRSAVSKNIGIGAGFSYSLLSMNSSQFVLVDSTGRMGESNVQNSLGVNISLFYSIKINDRFTLRPGVDAHLMRAHIQYDTRLTNKKNSEVFPVAVEVPIMATWGLSKNSTYESGIYATFGIRPVIAVRQFISLYPTMKPANVNIDAGIGLPLHMKKLTFRMEAIYSHGLLNLIGKNAEDFHTNSISYLGRSYAGLRFYFN